MKSFLSAGANANRTRSNNKTQQIRVFRRSHHGNGRLGLLDWEGIMASARPVFFSLIAVIGGARIFAVIFFFYAGAPKCFYAAMTRVKFWGVRGSIPTPGPGTA